MKTTIYLLLILFTANLFGQETTESPNNDFKKILVGISFSPDYCFRTLSNVDGSSISNLIIDSRNNQESAKIGYTAGFNFIYNFNKRIGIGTGLLFSNKGYQTEAIGLIFGDMIDPRRDFIYQTTEDPAIPKNAKFIYNHYYLDIPLKGILTFGNGSFRFVTSIGVTTNILVNTTTTSVLEYADGSTEKSTQESFDSYNGINFSPLISLGIEKKIKNKSFIRIEPTFMYGVLKIIDAPITANLWNAGLNISYYFGLK